MREIYLDNSATTKAYESVGELVYKVMCEDYGNPSSRHVKGVTAEWLYQRGKGNTGEAYESTGKRDFLYFRRNRER